jgi:predicted dinucleotide-binding enzyme
VASAHPEGSAGWAAAKFPGALWVKAFNSVYFKTLESEAHRTGDRVGIPRFASDVPSAMQTSADLVRDAGFDPVISWRARAGRRSNPTRLPTTRA